MRMKALLLSAALSAVNSLSASTALRPPVVKTSPHPSLPARTIAPGAFKPSWDSLATNYRCPEWFRDAKFGIWAHWSAQCQPEAGDWYARQMYIQDSYQYKDHLQRYGHPSEFGFKDIDNAWKAENWDPSRLMSLYKAAGAKYFVALANHHDNFDNYDSTYQEWNSVKVGPRQDLIGAWEKAARAQGLRFGVSNHSAHAWHWFQTAYGYDPEGAKAGIRYDGWLTKADGKGKWWEGLDPQELYGGVNMAPPDGMTTVKDMDAWHEKYDRQWSEEAPANNSYYTDKWYLRTQELLDKYRPDLIYFDNMDLPLGQAGLDITAHYYNSNMALHGGKLEAVVNAKNMKVEHRSAVVEDYERGSASGIPPDPWQTDTCIGSWHYDKGIFERHGYKTASEVIHKLIDIVSRNGNLLLSVPLKGDGSLDDDELKILKDLAAWMAVNEEGIFGTRPWLQSGEGPTRVASGMFNEGNTLFTPRDFRFTTKAGVLYATAMALPDKGQICVRSLAKTVGEDFNTIESVSLLGSSEKLKWEQGPEGLLVKISTKLPSEHTLTLKIKGQDLKPVPFAEVIPVQVPDAHGDILLPATEAQLHGGKVVLEAKHDIPSLGYWSDAADWVSWQVKFPGPGSYRLSASCASISDRVDFVVEVGAQKAAGKAKATGAWDVFEVLDLGILKIDVAGEATVKVRARNAGSWKPMNLRYVKFTLVSTRS